MVIDTEHLYKEETGSFPVSECEFEVWRSRGQWILNISDEEKIESFGNEGYFSFPDKDYLNWLENKVMELLNSK